MYFSQRSSPVERERLRERQREERAQMTYSSEQRNSHELAPTEPLFGELVKVNPKSGDRETQQIQRKLGKFEDVKHLLTEQVDANLFGVDGTHPPPSPAPVTMNNKSIGSSSSASGPSNPAAASMHGHEFKKPNASGGSGQQQTGGSSRSSSSSYHRAHHHSSSSSSSGNLSATGSAVSGGQRSGFLKPDGKPSYSSSKNFYPSGGSDSVKHSDFRNSSMSSSKNLPPSTTNCSMNSASSHHSSSLNGRSSSSSHSGYLSNKNVPKLHFETPSVPPLNTSSQLKIENILDEMTAAVRTPLTGIAATPRKEIEPNFTFNPISGKMESLVPPVKPADNKNKSNALNSILGPPGRSFASSNVPLFSAPVQQTSSTGGQSNASSPATAAHGSSFGGRNVTNNNSSPFTAFSSSSSSAAAINANNTNSNSGSTGNSNGSTAIISTVPSVVAPAANASNVLSQTGSLNANLPVTSCLKSDLSLSEDSDEDESDDESVRVSSKIHSQEPPPAASDSKSNLDRDNSKKDNNNMSPEQLVDCTTSSDDSESDSGSDSDESSSEESTSPSSLPMPVVTEQEEKHRWNLKNFLPPSTHESVQSNQSSQKTDSEEKSKTDDSDSSGCPANKSSSSSSSSDSESNQSTNSSSNRQANSNISKSNPHHSVINISSDDEAPPLRRHSRCSSRCNSSDEGDQPNRDPLIGIVRPSQRKPPSPIGKMQNNGGNSNANNSRSQMPPALQNMSSESNDERFDYLQKSLQNATAETNALLGQPSVAVPPDNSTTVVRQELAEPQQQQQQQQPKSQSFSTAMKVPSSSRNRARKGKSPATSALLKPSASMSPVKKKRGCTRNVKTSLPSESEDEDDPKMKIPERRRPGRPPTKRLATNPVTAHAYSNEDSWSRRKIASSGNNRKSTIVDGNQSAGSAKVWAPERERRSTITASHQVLATSAASASAAPTPATAVSDYSDSDVEVLPPAPAKPTARVIPAVKGKNGRASRESSCDSARNDNDFSMMLAAGCNSVVGATSSKIEESPPKLDVEGISVSDKKKSDTLRKLFTRREEGGAKGGKGGKGGKGKGGVIIVESESEHKLSKRYLTAGSPHRFSSDRSAAAAAAELSAVKLPPSAVTPTAAPTTPEIENSRLVPDVLPSPPTSNVRTPPSQQQQQQQQQSQRLDITVTNIQPPGGGGIAGRDGLSPPSINSDMPIPRLTINADGRPSLMCKIDLSRLGSLQKFLHHQQHHHHHHYPIKSDHHHHHHHHDKLNSASTPSVLLPTPTDTRQTASAGGNSGNSFCSTPRIVISDDTAPAAAHHSHAMIGTSTSGTKLISNIVGEKQKKHRSERKYKRHRKDKLIVPPSSQLIGTPRSCSSDSDTETPRMRSPLAANCPAAVNNCSVNGCADITQQHHVAPNVESMDIAPYYSSINHHGMLGIEDNSDVESWSNGSSCASSSSSSVVDLLGKYMKIRKSSLKSKHRKSRRNRRMLKSARLPVHPSLNEPAPTPSHIPSTNHDRSSLQEPLLNNFPITEMMRPIVPLYRGIYYSYLEHKASEEICMEDNISPNVYLIEAKRLKHTADGEPDTTAQGMKYLEAILGFVLTGHALERKNQLDTAFSMYRETLKLIMYISKKYRIHAMNTIQPSIPSKICVLSLRCESILSLKLHKMRENEIKEVNAVANEYYAKAPLTEAYMMNNTPSPHSPSPSPASSIGSHSSSGYSTDKRPGYYPVPTNVHSMLLKQHMFYNNLASCFSYWDEADRLIFRGNKEFFIELDRFCGPLTLHSSLKDLVQYVRVGIQRIKGIISHNHIGPVVV